MYQVPNQINKTQYLSLIDKCTQILRQDRIWLRNLLKSNNQDVLYLFKGLPKNLDMKQLQIKLRKYIMRAKQKQKQQQLQRFKQNMHLPDFVQVISDRKNQLFTQNKSQTKNRGPLRQNQSNQPKSSFVAKWNNYSHYNQPINLMQNRSQISQLSQNQNRSLKKQWSNNYKPHSFNRNLNGQLTNKLSNKNNSLSNQNRHNKSTTSLPKDRNFMNSRFQNNQENEEFGQNKYPLGGGRNSSKSLKQLENKIYQELRLFQQNKHKKQTQNLNKTYSQRSVQKYVDVEKQSQNIQQTQKAAALSKQNIDEILKFKLGNCDYQSYRKSQQSQNQEQQEYSYKQKSTSQKKLYDQGLFPPIQEQTERDSQSQRYPEEPLRFGMNVKQQIEDKHKMTFASFAKVSPNQTFKSYDLSEGKMITSTKHNIQQFHEFQEDQHQYPIEHAKTINSNPMNNFVHVNYEQPLPQKKVSESLYQSAQKKSDIQQNYVESDLHKSIMESIKKSRQMFPEQNYSHKTSQSHQLGVSKTYNFSAHHSIEKPLQLPQPKHNQISSFQSSLYSSTHDDQGLFTSPELLNECRNFLRKTQQINFENSGLRDFTNSIQHSKFESPLSSQQKSFKQTFNNFSNTGMINFPQPITITESITKDFYDQNSESKINSLFESKQSSINKNNNIQFQTYSKPQYIQNDSFKKSQFVQSSIKKSQNNEFYMPHSNKRDAVIEHNHSRKNSSLKKHSEIEQTLALPTNPIYFNMSNASKKNNQSVSVIAQGFKTSQFASISKDQQNKKSVKNEQPIQQLIQFEQIIDKLLQENQGTQHSKIGNLQVESSWLKHTINNQCMFSKQVGFALRKILKAYIQSDNTFDFLQIINTVQQQYRKNPDYKNLKGPSSIMYGLLDIEQKGFVNFNDVQNFVTQLQNAQVQNIEEIAHYMEEVFDKADFNETRQISYVNLYIIKNQDCFQNLWNYIKDFQFEISDQK